MARPVRRLTHEQAVEFGRKGGLARQKGNLRRYDATITVRVPFGLKEWYERRAKVQGVSVTTLVREILQAKREPVTGEKIGGLGQI